MVLERPEPGEVVWMCRACGKVYKAEEIDAANPPFAATSSVPVHSPKPASSRLTEAGPLLRLGLYAFTIGESCQ